jgi:hypothetical protein
LKARRAIEVPIYDFSNHSRTDRSFTVNPRGVLVVEGILIFADAALRALFDVKIFVDTDADIRLIRRSAARYNGARPDGGKRHQAVPVHGASDAPGVRRTVQALCRRHHPGGRLQQQPPWTWLLRASNPCSLENQINLGVEMANKWNTPPAMEIDPKKTYTARMETDKGEMLIELFAAKVPKTVNNFVFLARQGFYDGMSSFTA